MPQDASFVFNNKKGGTVQNFTQNSNIPNNDPNLNVVNPTADPLAVPNPNPSQLPGNQPINPNPVIPTQTLPDISSFSAKSNVGQNSQNIKPSHQDETYLDPNVQTNNMNVSQLVNQTPAQNPEPTPIQTPAQVPVQAPVPVPNNTDQAPQPQPDFRALAEELVMNNESNNENVAVNTASQSTTDQGTEPTIPPAPTPMTVTENINPTLQVSPAQQPNIQNDPVSSTMPDKNTQQSQTNPTTQFAVSPVTAPVSSMPGSIPAQVASPTYNPNNIEPQLESDPLIQEVQNQDVKIEREALETLIASNRIDSELKEHLKIELLKFKDMEGDLVPIGQDINTIAAEVMAPEPTTPIVNPIQTIPPQMPR